MNLIEILKIYGLDETVKTKLVRHQSSDFDLNRLFANDQIELYQSVQGKNIFSNCQQIVSFIGDGGSRSKFIGIFKVIRFLHINGLTAIYTLKCLLVNFNTNLKEWSYSKN